MCRSRLYTSQSILYVLIRTNPAIEPVHADPAITPGSPEEAAEEQVAWEQVRTDQLRRSKS
jgi:hypothetical protein